MFNNLKKLLGLSDNTQTTKPNQQAALQQPLVSPVQTPQQIPNSIRRPANPGKNYLGSNGDIQLSQPGWRTNPVQIPSWKDPLMYGQKNEQGVVEGGFEGSGSLYINPADIDPSKRKPIYRVT